MDMYKYIISDELGDAEEKKQSLNLHYVGITRAIDVCYIMNGTRRYNQIYGIETNFYGGGGSKLNETARSYKMLSQEADTIDGFTFVWFTDGIGWKSAKGNLRETFDVMDAIYCIDDMENGVMDEVFVD